MTNATQLPSAASWALTGAAATSAEAAWTQFSASLATMGFANLSYINEAPRFIKELPSSNELFGFMVSPEWMHAVRTDQDSKAMGYKIPAASSVGVGVSMIPEQELQLPQLSEAERYTIGHIRDHGMLGGWTFPVADRQTNTFSALLIDCSCDADDHQRLTDENRDYLQLSSVYFREGLVIQGLMQEMGPDLLSVRERDCLAWTAAGKSTKEIADVLGIATSTVNEYIAHAQRKLKAKNRTQAAARALLLGVIGV